MSILVKLSATFREVIPGYNPNTGLEVKYLEGLTVTALAESLGLPLGEIKIIMVNGCQAEMGQLLNDNDRVAYFPPVGGG